jgi:hypothetical protein
MDLVRRRNRTTWLEQFDSTLKIEALKNRGSEGWNSAKSAEYTNTEIHLSI